MSTVITQEIITPDLAREYLTKNISNRPISEKHIAALAGSMRRGEWMFTGESIKFSEGGVLLDGQHRLTAIVASGVSVPMIVIRGLKQEAFHAIDIGAKKRGLSDILAITGEKYWCLLAASLYLIASWEDHVGQNIDVSGGIYSVAQAEDVLVRHPGIRDHLCVADRLKSILNPSLSCVFSYLFSLSSEEKSKEFFDSLQHGAGLQKGSPVLLLRDRLFMNKTAKAKLPKKEIAALTIKAFNGFRSGRQLGLLRWADNEKFPMIDGVAIKKFHKAVGE